MALMGETAAPHYATDETARKASAGRLATAGICAASLALFAALAWSAVRTKCATFDEPNQVVAAFVQFHHHSFMLDPEDPPLWKFWAPLLTSRDSLHLDRGTPLWNAMPADIIRQALWAQTVLYQPVNDADTLLARCRAMMLAIGVGLGAMIAWWSWRLGGAVAAIVAVLLFALDPNFLAHAPLVKNDVVLSLVAAGLCYALWRAGQALTWTNAAAIVVLSAVALTVKFSGLLLPPIAVMLLLLRAMLPWDWPVLGRHLTTRTHRLLATICLAVAAAVFSYAWIWACYGFHFAPDAADPHARTDIPLVVRWTIRKEFYLQHAATAAPGWFPEESDVASVPPSLKVRLVLAAEKHHLFPHSFLAGLLLTYQGSLMRPTFLLGQVSETGWWYYFPLAMLLKTPLATLLAALLSLAALSTARQRANVAHQRWWNTQRLWTASCLALPPLLYLAAAMGSNINLGLRHVLPVYPMLYIAIGLAAAYAWSLPHWRRRTAAVITCLALGLAAETAFAFPDYIPFFNAVAGGAHGGVHLLTDSNLDWGQDLKLLGQWQQAHPDRKLYLCYFGRADPRYYGIRYTNLPGSLAPGAIEQTAQKPCVLAISATRLVGSESADEPSPYAPLLSRTPMAILGGSIYLYDMAAP
jgi:4-amino-4-deoxy-L-arabinose transferase-like glycosyltransferase